MANPNNAKPCTCGHNKGDHRLVMVSRREVRLGCAVAVAFTQGRDGVQRPTMCVCPKYVGPRSR